MPPLDLARRRRVALFGVELLRNDAEFLDLLDTRELRICLLDLASDQLV